MATTTPNYSLRKPAATDNVNVALDISGNMDLLDAHTHSGTYVASTSPDSYGAVGNGTTDDSVAVQAAIQAAYDAGGGTVFLTPGKTYRCDSQLTMPYATLGSRPIGKAIRITGMSAGRSTLNDQQASTDPSASGLPGLDLRYSGTGAKIVALGQGVLELDHLVIKDLGTSSTPFVLLTGCQPRIHKVDFYGNPNKRRKTCDQDCVVLGGTDTTQGTTSLTSAFNGYGGYITENTGTRIRRLAYLRNFANGIQIRGNWVSDNCGSDQALDAPIVLDSGAAGSISTTHVQGNVIADNTLEITTGYSYAVMLKNNARKNSIYGNGFWDPITAAVDPVTPGKYLYDVSCDTSCLQNVLIMSGYSQTYLVDPNWLNGAAINNMYIAPIAAGTPLPISGGTITAATTSFPALRLDHAAGHGTDTFQVRLNAAKMFWVDQSGEAFAYGNMIAPYFGVGADTAGGGSNMCFLRAANGLPSAGLGNDGDYYLRKDGTAGASLYHKISGAWVAIDTTVTAATATALTGAWTTYTPTWGNMTIGNATVTARYRQIGKTVEFMINMQVGTTTSFTASGVFVSAPAAALASARYIVPVRYLQSGVREWVGTANITSSGIFPIQPGSGNGGGVNSSNPFTFATGDQIDISGTYEAA